MERKAIIYVWQGGVSKTVVQSLLLHSFRVYLWPLSLIKQLHCWARNFILSGDYLARKMALVSWDQICAPKQEGGLGLKKFDILNKSCLLKFVWEVRNSKSICSDYLQSRYSFTHPQKIYDNSSLWAGFRSTLTAFDSGARWIIGDGSSINF